MFDTWDWWGTNYGVPIEDGGDGNSSSGFNLQETINRALEILGGRYGGPGYISPDDPRYGRGGYGSYPRGQSPYPLDQYGNPTIGGGGNLSLTPLTIGVGLLVLYLVMRKK